MLTCMFCRCQMPAAAARTKYVEHLQVALHTLLAQELIATSQDWHMVMVPEEVELAVRQALQQAGLGQGGPADPGVVDVGVQGRASAGEVCQVEVKEELEEEVKVKEELVEEDRRREKDELTMSVFGK